MKLKTTKKTVEKDCFTVQLGYDEAQHVLGRIEASAYTCGALGWNADVYLLGNGKAISTGYRPFGHRPSRRFIEKLRKLDRKFEERIEQRDCAWLKRAGTLAKRSITAWYDGVVAEIKKGNRNGKA